MLRVSHIAAPLVLGLGLSLGLAGCADHDRAIPNDAVILREGRNALSATANQPGTVYVYDNSTNKLLYSGPVAKNDVVRVDPSADRITVNGNTVSQQSLDDAHHYRIYEEEQFNQNQQGSVIGQTNATEQNNGNSTVVKQEGDQTVVHEPGANTTVITRPKSDTTIIRHGDNGSSDQSE